MESNASNQACCGRHSNNLGVVLLYTLLSRPKRSRPPRANAEPLFFLSRLNAYSLSSRKLAWRTRVKAKLAPSFIPNAPKRAPKDGLLKEADQGLGFNSRLRMRKRAFLRTSISIISFTSGGSLTSRLGALLLLLLLLLFLWLAQATNA